MASHWQQLKALFEKLDEHGQRQLLEFAEFLQQKHPRPDEALAEPEPIPRPQGESVVAAMKRLNRTYPMLDKGPILHEASALLAQHMMQGRAADVVIDELEIVFQRHYQRLNAKQHGG